MDIKKLRFKTTAVLFLVSAALLLSSSLVYAADDCRIIRIQQDKGAGGTRIQIVPEKLTVPVGACTVWINRVMDREVRVGFKENAKQCKLSTDAASGFEKLDLDVGESCYYSERMPRGKTASVVWTQPGKFKYQLEAARRGTTEGFAGEIVAEGVIEVK
jgi:hypothetical protein